MYSEDDEMRSLQERVEDLESKLEAILKIVGNEHYVTFDKDGFIIEHSFEERLNGTMAKCSLNDHCRGYDNDPDFYGRWKADFKYGNWQIYIDVPFD